MVPTRCDTSPYSSLILLCASSLFHSEDGDRDKTRQEYCCTGYTDNSKDLETFLFFFFLLSHFNNHNSWQNRADFVDERSTKARFWIDRLIVWRTRTVCMKGVCLSLPLLSQVLDFWKISASERTREWESELPPELLWSCQRGDRPPREAPPQSSYLLLKHFLHNNDSKTGVSLFCAWWWHKMQSTQLQQIQSNFRWFFIHRPSFSVSSSLTSLSSSPPPSSSLPSQIPASIFLACVKLSDKKEFGLNDFIEKEIQ